MKRYFLVLSAVVFPFLLLAEEITKVSGYAPKYVGKQIEIFQIMDYISMKQERIATATVKEDSTFSCSFYLDETRKLIIGSNNNTAQFYAVPGATYEVYLPDHNPHDPYRPLGNQVELTFIGLDSTDINYKILAFNRWSDEFIATFYTRNNAEAVYFSKRLDTFKMDVERYYKADTADRFFMAHVKFSIAKLDDLRFLGSRNQYEKYDFYLKNYPVYYQSDAYMEYAKHYYEKLLPRINSKINEQVYQALLKSSPTLIMRAFAQEYTMNNNRRLRELMMIKVLSEAYYDKDYPQTNILTVLDSVSRFALFENNKVVAANVIARLTELAAGSRAPDFNLPSSNGTLHNLQRYEGKYLYLFFVDADAVETKKQLDLLVPIYQRYTSHVRFLMVIRQHEKSDPKSIEALQQSVPWESVAVDSRHAVFASYQVTNTPYYSLIDPTGYVVISPALGPVPNGQYETIDKTFFMIKKALEEGR